MKVRWARRRRGTGILLAALALSLPAPALLYSAYADEAVTELYMDPDGSDDASGTADDPAPSMARVIELLAGIDSSAATIYVDVGTYYETERAAIGNEGGTGGDQEVDIPQSELTIRPIDEDGENPVFDGSDLDDDIPDDLQYWLYTEDTSVHVTGLTIQHYLTGGLRLINADDNTVSHTVFRELGNKYVEGDTGYGALHLKESSNNIIHNNDFVRLNNVDGETGWSRIHGVYLAQNSHENQIYENTFDEISGDPVRLRNHVSHNDIHNNTFLSSGYKAMVSYWVMDGDSDEYECGTDNDVSSNSWNEESYHDDEGFPIMMSGAEDEDEVCENAVSGEGNDPIG